MWAARPLFFILGAHPPNPLGGGASPSTPCLPALVGFEFAGVFGPPRGGFAGVGTSPFLKSSWGGHPPQPPARGLRPLDPYWPTPVD